MTIVPPASAERTGYPTQKPVRLLERIVAASSRPGDLVLDPFAGLRDDGRGRGAARAAVAAGGPEPGRRGDRPGAAGGGGRGGRAVIGAITLDFGNTLVPVSAAGLRGVVAQTAAAMAGRLGPFDVDEVLRAWGEERERQFREEVPQFREVDLAQRIVRILARLRGMAPPPAGRALGRRGRRPPRPRPDEVAWAVEVYSRAFVAALPPAPGRRGAARAARRALPPRRSCPTGRSRRPSTATWRRPGWAPHLAAVVVSQRVGTIKPHPAIFAAARTALGDPEPAEILHVGDDWAADVVGAKRAGWRAA